MIKNFFEYVKELIPEEGSSRFRLDNHSPKNDITLYQLADLICGKSCDFADEVVSYSWNVLELWRYIFPTMGVKFAKTKYNYEERWCHFSKEAFVGAICIVAIRNGITFDDEVHEQLRQMWERKLKGEGTEEEKKYFDNLEFTCMNFDDVWYINKQNAEERGRKNLSEEQKQECFDYDLKRQERREQEQRGLEREDI